MPTSGMTFERQVMILRGFIVLSDFGRNPVHYKRVVNRLNVACTQVSGSNSFFVGLGLLHQVEEGTYLPTDCATAFYSELPGEEDYTKIQSCLRESDLYHLVRDNIRIRGAVSKNDIIDEILRVSQTSVKARAERAFEWLVRSELVEVSDNGMTKVH